MWVFYVFNNRGKKNRGRGGGININNPGEVGNYGRFSHLIGGFALVLVGDFRISPIPHYTFLCRTPGFCFVYYGLKYSAINHLSLIDHLDDHLEPTRFTVIYHA